MRRSIRVLSFSVLAVLVSCSDGNGVIGSGDDPPEQRQPPTWKFPGVHLMPTVGDPVLPEEPWQFPPLQTELPRLELDIPSSALSALNSDVTANVRYDAEFKAADGFSSPIQVRYRGASSRHFPKKSYKVYFPDGVEWNGRTKLNLVAEYQDATAMAEKLAYDALAALRVPAPIATWYRLYLNGRYQGVYLDIQQVDKRFLRAHHFADRDANIYRCGWKDCEMKTWQVPYQGEWEKKTNELEPHDDLVEFLHMVNHSPEPELPRVLAERMELDAYLRMMVMDNMVSNNFVEDSESFLIHDRMTMRWSYVPWDLNNADSRWWVDTGFPHKPKPTHPLFIFSLMDGWTNNMYDKRKGTHPGYLPVYSNLHTRIVFNHELRSRLIGMFDRALREVFEPTNVQARIDAMYQLIEPHMMDDPYIDKTKFKTAYTYFKNFFAGRDTFVRAELDELRNRQAGMVIDAFDPQEGWVEFRNRGSTPVALGTLNLTTNLRKPFDGRLPSRTVQPGDTIRVQASQLGTTFSPDGEIGLFDGSSITGVVDLLFYGALPQGQYYARSAERPELWEIRTR